MPIIINVSSIARAVKTFTTTFLCCKEPKAVLRISELNVAFAPPKTGNQNSLQISFMKDGTTRHIYVYHEDPEVITNWYLAIRCAKLHRLQVAYPGATEAELLSQLTRDFPREGFLWKTGPRHTDAYKKRWFTLDGRKLMYHDDPMVRTLVSRMFYVPRVSHGIYERNFVPL